MLWHSNLRIVRQLVKSYKITYQLYDTNMGIKLGVLSHYLDKPKLSSFQVDEKYRNQGYGTYLLNYACQ